MDHDELAKMCHALGDPSRAHIFQFLVGCCCPVAVGESGDVMRTSGPTAGEVCCHVTGGAQITSTVSFHLKELRNAGLITMQKRGKQMVCGVNQEAVAMLAEFFAQAKGGGGLCQEEDCGVDGGDVRTSELPGSRVESYGGTGQFVL